MPEAPHCPRCNALMLSFASPEGLCPRCLMGVAMGEPSELALDETDTRLLPKEAAGSEIDVSEFDTRMFPDGAARQVGRELLAGLVGQVLDEKYRIERKLGQGGMGAVYLATHLGTQRPVAVKVISPELMANEEFVERFRREAHASGRLRHPNIVNVTDFGFDWVDGARLAYLVMEYLDGQSLADYLARNKRPGLEWTIEVLEQVCSAVDEAHRLGIVHRDLKPANILLEPNRRGGFTVKVLDFGLAKLRDPRELLASRKGTSSGRMAIPSMFGLAAPDRPETTHDAPPTTVAAPEDAGSAALTRVGTVLGTPMYMAPEQCLGKPCDARSDVYSLGVIAYEMLSGEPPFAGNSTQMVRQHVERAPEPLRERTPDLSLLVESLVMQALEKRPGDRPQNAAALATALRAGADDRRAVMRQALALYGEHFWTFFGVALFGGHVLLALVLTLSLMWPVAALASLIVLMLGAISNGMMTVPLTARVLQGLPPFGLREYLGSWRGRFRIYDFDAGDVFDTSGLWRAFIILVLLCFSPVERNIPGTLLMMLVLCALLTGSMSSRCYLSGAVATVEGRREKEDGTNRVEALARRMKEAYGSFPPRGIKSLETLVIMSLFLAAMSGWFLVQTQSWGTIGDVVTWNSRRLAFLPVTGQPETSGWLTLTIAGTVLSCLVGVLVNPLVAIVHALTYLKARQLGGEGIEEIALRGDEK
jgi:serine/threonine protein kinase